MRSRMMKAFGAILAAVALVLLLGLAAATPAYAEGADSQAVTTGDEPALEEAVSKSGWVSSGGRWYYYDPEYHYMYAGGVYKIGSRWYGFSSSGAMYTGWRSFPYSYEDEYGQMQSGSDWYYFTSSGAAAVGWQKIGGKWYYFDEDYAFMYEDCTVEIGSKIYGFNSSGAMVTGWKKFAVYYYDEYGDYLYSEDAWYYFASSGAALTGWQKIGGVWYYFYPRGYDDAAIVGQMAVDWEYIGGKWYYFRSSGAMATGWVKWKEDTWSYLSSSGAALIGWQKIGGKWYYFDSYGDMQTGWLTSGGKRYFMNSSGAMVTGWQKISGKWYWFDSSGAMGKSRWVGNYYLGSDGVMLTNTITPDGYRVGADGKWDGKGKVA